MVYEGADPVFIDTEYDTWCMDPVALEEAFRLYPEVKVVVCANLYGTPAKLDEIRDICSRHGAALIEDAAESLGATYKGRQTGTFGDYNAISFNGNKIITGSAGGMFLTDSIDDANKVRKWSTQSRENAPWYQHEELGYNYRISNYNPVPHVDTMRNRSVCRPVQRVSPSLQTWMRSSYAWPKNWPIMVLAIAEQRICTSGNRSTRSSSWAV